MAEIIENPFSKNFSIEDTGLGNAELLQGLYSDESESATGDPDKIEKIVTEVEQKSEVIKPAKVKEISGDEKVTDELPSGQDIVSSFLSDGEDESEEEEVEKTDEVIEKTGSDESSEDETQYSLLANDLVKLGVFTKEEGEEDVAITTPQEFLDRFNAEKVKGAQQMVDNFIAQFGQDYQDAFQAIYVKGVDPKEYFGTYNNIVKFAELDLTVKENQIVVIRQALADQGFESDDIDTELEQIENYGDLESKATKYHKVLVKKEAVKLQQLEQQAEHDLQQKNAIRGVWIQNVQNILQDKIKAKEFDGIPLNPKLANELQDFLLVDKWKTGNNELLSDFDKTILELKRPENHVTKVKIALLMKLLEKDPTLSTIQRSGITKKSDVIFEGLARQKTQTVKTATNQGTPFRGL